MAPQMDIETPTDKPKKMKKSKLNKNWVMASLAVFILAVCLIVAVIKIKNFPPKLCTTPDCIHTASYVLSTMKTKIDPCEDFYEYVCGNFIKTIPSDHQKGRYSISTKVFEQVDSYLKTIVTAERRADDSEAYTMVKNIYDVCVNTTKIDEQGLEPLLAKLDQLGGWPVVSRTISDPENVTWFDHVKNVWSDGFFLFLSYYISRSQYINILTPNCEQKCTKNESDGKQIAIYKEHMVQVAELLGADKDYAVSELNKTFQFELDLNELKCRQDDKTNITEKYYTLDELDKKFSGLNLKNALRDLLEPYYKLNDSIKILLENEEYLTELMELLNKTDKFVLKNYKVWKFLEKFTQYLPEKFRNVGVTVEDVKTSQTKREADCLNALRHGYPSVFLVEFVKRFIDADARSRVEKIAGEIRESLEDAMSKTSWLHEDSKKKAMDVFDSTRLFIGYPDRIMDPSKLNEIYEELNTAIDPETSILETFLKIKNHTKVRSLEKYQNKIIHFYWDHRPFLRSPTASYSKFENTIEITATFLQDIFYSSERPNYMNYGGMGSVLGHEISHAINGKDIFGNQEIDWWKEQQKNTVAEKTQCFKDQYSEYGLLGVHLNGNASLAENIADNFGIKLAYMAYSKWAEKNTVEPKMPGLDFSPNQMFWISLAESFCEDDRLGLSEKLANASHAPPRFRIIGSVSNSDEFSKDFNCPAGSKMNPQKKCTIF